jgi:deoxyribonuclease V
MKIRFLHNWDLSPKDAAEIQNGLRNNLRFIPFEKPVKIAVGVDLSFVTGSNVVFAAAIAWDTERREVVETATEQGEASFPYIPGFLAFRELPFITRALAKLQTVPDVILVDGHGICHPRGFGVASHLGLMVDVPTIGCAKTRLVGEFQQPALEKFATSPLFVKGEAVGAVLRSRTNVKPVFVSPGNMIDLASSVEVVKNLVERYRIPEPLRHAHICCNEFRRASYGI